MHDQGPLPLLKEGGPISFLIGCVEIAKQHSDDFFTKQIEEGKRNNENKTKKAQHEQHHEQSDSPNTEAKKSSIFPNKRPKQ